MSLATDFADLAVQTVTVEQPLGPPDSDLYGTHGWGTPIVYQARVVAMEKQLHLANGDDVVSRTQADVFGATGLTTKCRFTLPNGSQPPVLSVDSYPDETGDHYERVYFGGA